ncbi:hypothetical protein GCM10018962_77220 [Dactylosporangium matsuzakiense]|uniref:phage portal protein n=1 Tax=Dactylosporangium matsuzakiense TaxID=53360 RepID=UPI0031EEB98C
MPLPENGLKWPPPAFDKPHEKMREHDAWYSGDPTRLTGYYTRSTEAPTNRPSQYRGGVIGALARFAWGRPVPQGQTDRRIHVPAPGDLATASADLLFSEAPRLVVADKTAKEAQKALDDLTSKAQLKSRLNEAGEVGAALGGSFLRTWWDTGLADHPLLQVVHPDRAYPDMVGGILTGVSFVHQVDEDGNGKVLRHVERHDRAGSGWVVLHGLYEGTRDNLGRAIDLKGHPATAGFAPRLDAPGGVPMVYYTPNMLPNPQDRGSWLGRSDYTRSEALFDWLDETYSSWRRDVENGKGRLIVPTEYVDNLGPGRGTVFDLDRAVYHQLAIPPMGTTGSTPITVAQFAIRVQEHRDTCREILTQIVTNGGYHPATFGLVEEGAAPATATEIRARQARSFSTRAKKADYFRPSMAGAGRSLSAIAEEIFGVRGLSLDIDVTWPDGVAVDQLTLANTAQLLRAADAASDETIVRTVHPDWEPDQVAAEVAAIVAKRDADRQAVLPDPGDPGDGFPA